MKRAELRLQLAQVEHRIETLEATRAKLIQEREELKVQLAGQADGSMPRAAAARPSLIEVASQRDGLLIRMGKSWKVGDRVKEGQVLVRLDDRFIRAELAASKARQERSKAAFLGAQKSAEEAKKRYERRLALAKKALATDEDAQMAGLTWQHMQAELIKSRADVKMAEAELDQALTLLDMHTIRSPVSGVIWSIRRQPGEYVKAGQTVMEVLPQRTGKWPGVKGAAMYCVAPTNGMHMLRAPGEPGRRNKIIAGSLPGC